MHATGPDLDGGAHGHGGGGKGEGKKEATAGAVGSPEFHGHARPRGALARSYRATARRWAATTRREEEEDGEETNHVFRHSSVA